MCYSKLIRQSVEALRGIASDLREGINKIEGRIQEYKESVDAANKSQREYSEIRDKWNKERLAENQVTGLDLKRRDDRNHRVQESIRWATWIAAIGAWVYGGIAAYQAYEMRAATKATQDAAAAAVKSNELTKDLLRGANAAYFVANIQSQSITEADREIRVSFINSGKVNAQNVQGTVEVCLETFPRKQRFRCQKRPFFKSQFRPFLEGDGISIRIDDVVATTDIQRLETDAMTVEVQGSIAFDDGFGDITTDSLCKMYFVRHLPGTDRVTERAWGNCEPVTEILSEELKNRLHHSE